jgi:phosphohistidine phosphatase SixA
MYLLYVIIGVSLLLSCSEPDDETLPIIEYYGEIDGFGIGFHNRPEFINIDDNLSIKDLLKGKYVLVTRHTLRDPKEGKELWSMDRSGKPGFGASLNDKGVLDAVTIKKVIDKLNIPIGDVYTSPSHRTRQLAEIAFSSTDFINKIELIYQPMMRLHEKSLFDLELLKLLSEPITDGRNRVLSAHNNTLERLGIKGLPSQKLEQGDTVVILPLGNSSFTYLGTISFSDWLNFL